MKSLVLDFPLAFFPGVRSTTVVAGRFQAQAHFGFAPEGWPFGRRHE